VPGAEQFAGAVLDRFRNPAISHALLDILLQATTKVRVRLVPMIERSIGANGRVPQSLAFGFAAFLHLMRGDLHRSRRARGLMMPVDDQGARLHFLWSGLADGADARIGDVVEAICRDVTLWGIDLAALPGFRDAVTDHLSRIATHGMSDALEHHLAADVA
nr:hypothetical protein [Gemmatimonadaceae bacterium]